MLTWIITLFLLIATVSCSQEEDGMAIWARAGILGNSTSHVMVRQRAVRMASSKLMQARDWALGSSRLQSLDHQMACSEIALSDCVNLYEDTNYRLQRLFLRHRHDDARTWLSGALTSHRTCLEGLREKSCSVPQALQNLTTILSKTLALYAQPSSENDREPSSLQLEVNQPLLVSWDASISRADFVVSKDGSSSYRTINSVVAVLEKRGGNRGKRVVIYVKAGVYNENVEIKRNMENVMFIGDGIDKTIITGNRNVHDGSSTISSATFGVSGDGFWARDMTFENIAGPEKHQAVAARVGSDHAIFYRCSFRGYQDTLFVHSQRQFYRECHIYGTQDFIFGNAAVVLQNCDIFVRRPMAHQSNVITAQGREDPNENTGISIHSSRVVPATDLIAVKGSFRSYLGRPWKKYSRTVFLKTDLDGLINPKGWTEWSGNFALSTLYYGEYMNYGSGASIGGRVKWPGFHVLNNPRDASPFTVGSFIQGNSWIPMAGVPFSAGL